MTSLTYQTRMSLFCQYYANYQLLFYVLKWTDSCFLWDNLVIQKAKSVVNVTPSGRRHHVPLKRSNRYSKTFISPVSRMLLLTVGILNDCNVGVFVFVEALTCRWIALPGINKVIWIWNAGWVREQPPHRNRKKLPRLVQSRIGCQGNAYYWPLAVETLELLVLAQHQLSASVLVSSAVYWSSLIRTRIHRQPTFPRNQKHVSLEREKEKYFISRRSTRKTPSLR